VRGYALARFGDAEDVTLALWDFERDPDNAREVTIGVGAAKVDVYDWMGNKTEQATESGKLTVVLSKEPIYIAGVDAKRWSGARSDRNIARGKAVTASSTAGGRYAAELAVDGDSVSHESRWCSEDDQKAAKWITVDLGAEHSIDEVRFWTGQYQPGWGANTYQQPLEKFSLQRWSEGKWVNLASRSGNKQAVVVERFDAVVASKVRLYVPAWSTSQIKLYELEIMQANAE
jgi:hypothetical protein